MNSIKVLYFSGTGNSYYVAKRIGGQSVSIPKLIKENTYSIKDEIIGIVFPVYFLGIPSIVMEYLKVANLKCDYLFAIVTYGGKTGNISSELLKLHKFDYINKVQMADNFLPLYDMKKEISTSKNIKAESRISKINVDISFKIINTSRKENEFAFPSPYFVALINKSHKKKIKYTCKKFSIDEKCDLCDLCDKVCPTNNVQVTDKVLFGNSCEGCLACIHICPKNAMHMKGQKSDTRYFHGKVNKDEFVASNK